MKMLSVETQLKLSNRSVNAEYSEGLNIDTLSPVHSNQPQLVPRTSSQIRHNRRPKRLFLRTPLA